LGHKKEVWFPWVLNEEIRELLSSSPKTNGIPLNPFTTMNKSRINVRIWVTIKQ
jgi:hypothetical protein